MSALDDAKTYVGDKFGPNYRTWEDLEPEDQQRTLNSSVAMLDALQWQGTATGASNAYGFTSWPRSGIDGVDSTQVPVGIVNGSWELAVLINADPDLPNKLDQGSNIQSVQGGGGVGVSYFAPTSAANGSAPVLPPIVQRLVGRYLASSITTMAGFISGTNAASNFVVCCSLCGASSCACAEQRRDVSWPV